MKQWSRVNGRYGVSIQNGDYVVHVMSEDVGVYAVTGQVAGRKAWVLTPIWQNHAYINGRDWLYLDSVSMSDRNTYFKIYRDPSQLQHPSDGRDATDDIVADGKTLNEFIAMWDKPVGRLPKDAPTREMEHNIRKWRNGLSYHFSIRTNFTVKLADWRNDEVHLQMEDEPVTALE